MWFYVRNVLVPYQRADAAAHNRPRGNLSDLYPRWLGARELLLNHRDPYSPEVTREIQAEYYGRVLDPHRPEDPKDQQGFAYPVYVVFLLAPLARLPFPVVQACFRWLLVILTAASVLLWLRALGWRPTRTTVATLVILALGSFPAVLGIELQQLSLLVGAMIAGCAVLVACGHLVLAGALLALATIKPQLTLPLAAWLILWALSDWRKRASFIWGFALTMAALLAGAQYLLPGWIGRFRAAIAAYRQYTGGPGSLLDVLITPGVGSVLAALIVLVMAGLCWRVRREPAGSPLFVLTLSLVLAVTVVIVPMVAPYNQLLLLPGVFLLVLNWGSLWVRSRLTRLACAIAAFSIFWPWLASLLLMVASFAVPAKTVERAWAVPLWTSLHVPLGILLPLGLLFADSLRRKNPAPLALSGGKR
jgi:hypothetical protein